MTGWLVSKRHDLLRADEQLTRVLHMQVVLLRGAYWSQRPITGGPCQRDHLRK